jgi:hypothetical protein
MIFNLFKPRPPMHWADAEVARRQRALREMQREDAIRYLRSQGKYCLDKKVERNPNVKPFTILHRWIVNARGKA